MEDAKTEEKLQIFLECLAGYEFHTSGCGNLSLGSRAGITTFAGGAFHCLECPENGNSNTAAIFQNISEKCEYSVTGIFRLAQRGQPRLFLEQSDKFRWSYLLQNVVVMAYHLAAMGGISSHAAE